MSRFLILIFVTSLLSLSTSGYAGIYDIPGTNNRLRYEIVGDPSNQSVVITDCNEHASGSLAIPSSIEGLPVTAIGEGVFLQCHYLQSIIIPETVTQIINPDFGECSVLTSLQVALANTHYASQDGVLYNAALTELVAYPLSNSATEFTIPDGVTSIGDRAFKSARNLTSIVMPSSVTTIGEEAFNYNRNITSIEIPSGVTSLGARAFISCRKLTDIAIPASVTMIGEEPFLWCVALESIEVDAANTHFSSQDGILYNKLQTALLAYPAGKPSATYSIPATVTTIANRALAGCDNLSNVTIPDGVTSIGDGAFRSSDHLTSIFLPASVTSIGEACFSYCRNFSNIEVAEANPSYASLDGVLFNHSFTELLSYPGAKAGAVYTIPAGVTNIGAKAFQLSANLTDVIMPASLRSIGDWAFADSGGFTNLTIPSGVTSISDYAFTFCWNLSSVSIPDTVTSIGDFAFYSTRLASVTIPDSVTEIGQGVFYGCDHLTSASIGSGVTHIDGQTFFSCDILQNIDVSPGNANYTSMDGVVYNKSLTELVIYPTGRMAATFTIPATVTRIGANAFAWCPHLTHIILPATIEALGDEALNYCPNVSMLIFAGDAPQTLGLDAIRQYNDFAVYYYEGNEGFLTPIWNDIPTTMLDRDHDLDADGWQDLIEYRLGTLADQPSDYFRSWLSQDPAGNPLLHYEPHSAEVTIQVEVTNYLSDPNSWQPVHGLSFTNEGADYVAELPALGAQPVFYRVDVNIAE